MHKLIGFACEELEELERKVAKEGKISKAELEYAKELAGLKKDLLKGSMLEEEQEYSNAMSYRGGYSREGGYSRDMGYSRAEDFVRPDGSYRDGSMSYARGRGRGAKRDSMGRYSSAADEDMKMQLEMLMNGASDERTRSGIRELIDRM